MNKPNHKEYVAKLSFKTTMLSDTQKEMIVEYSNNKYIDGYYNGFFTGVTLLTGITIAGVLLGKFYKH